MRSIFNFTEGYTQAQEASSLSQFAKQKKRKKTIIEKYINISHVLQGKKGILLCSSASIQLKYFLVILINKIEVKLRPFCLLPKDSLVWLHTFMTVFLIYIWIRWKFFHLSIVLVQKMVSFLILWQDMQVFSFSFNKNSCLKIIQYAIQGNKVMVKLLYRIFYYYIRKIF